MIYHKRINQKQLILIKFIVLVKVDNFDRQIATQQYNILFH